MKKFKVYGYQKVYGYKFVEAESKLDALDVAWTEGGDFDLVSDKDDIEFESAEEIVD